MGANCQCGNGSKAEEVFKATPRHDDFVDPDASKVPVPPEFHKIQGMWKTEHDVQLMGEIRGSTVIWDKVFNLSQSKLRLASDGGFEMTLSGAIHKAKHDVHLDRLIWSDGEVWVRARKQV
eukprot:symbB.v1.2.011231.t1/scaffold751.1/size165343/2